MKVHSIRDKALGNTAYLVDVGGGDAVVIDPRRDAAEHLELAEERGLRIVAVLETHLHADFVSGAREVGEATGAMIVVGAGTDVSYSATMVEGGESLRFGAVTVDVIDTPGHTPEHVSFLFTDGGERALFSGGSLIVGGAARTDLSGEHRTAELTRAQFGSLRRLAELPDDTVLAPTHGAGSFCSTGPARSDRSTIGDERRSNPLFGITDEERFVTSLVAGFGSFPRYFAHLRAVNQRGAPLIATLPVPPRLSPREAAENEWLIDARGARDFAAAHAVGSISITLRSAFASWLGWVVPFDAPFVLILSPEQVPEALRQAHLIGYDRVLGWTTFDEWRASGLPVASFDVMDAGEAARRVADGATLLDIRQESEFLAGHATDAVHVELAEVIEGKTPATREVVTYCAHGERATTAASLLERDGHRASVMPGGVDEWRAAGFSVAP